MVTKFSRNKQIFKLNYPCSRIYIIISLIKITLNKVDYAVSFVMIYVTFQKLGRAFAVEAGTLEKVVHYRS